MNGIDPVFERMIGRNMSYWSKQLKDGSDAESRRLLPHNADVLQAVQFAIALPALQIDAVALFHHFFNLIERNRLEQLWLPIVDTLLLSERVQADDTLHQALKHRHATLLRLNSQLHAARSELEAMLLHPLETLLRGKVLLDLSYCCHQQSQNTIAMTHAEQALVCFDETGDKKWHASAHNNIGIYAIELGQFERAETHLEAAHQFELSHQDATRIVRVLTNLGFLYESQNEPWHALRIYFEAQEYLDDIESVGDRTLVLINLGNVYNQLKQYDKALAVLRAAGNQLEAQPHLHHQRGLVHLNLGVAYFYLGQFEQASSSAVTAGQIWEHIGMRFLLARCQTNLGDAKQKLGDFSAANAAYSMALKTLTPLSDTHRIVQLRQELSSKLDDDGSVVSG